MLLRTHLIITLFFIVLLLPFVSFKIIFVLMALLATAIPDIDMTHSKMGKKKIFRIFQIFLKHRGILHSFTFLFAVTFVFALFFPILALGFFVGYASHLFADSFTPMGIYPFYPWKRKSFGHVRTGTMKEITVSLIFLIGTLLLAFKHIFS